MPSNWSALEVEATVASYFTMLQAELAGLPFNKAAHERALLPLLDDRPKSSIPFKYANISAVLIELGMPYIDGYKPPATTNSSSLMSWQNASHIIPSSWLLRRAISLRQS